MRAYETLALTGRPRYRIGLRVDHSMRVPLPGGVGITPPPFAFPQSKMVPSAGFEPTTTDLEKRCSFQLSYEDRANWSGRQDSNLRQPAWKDGALPTELLPRKNIYGGTAGDRTQT